MKFFILLVFLGILASLGSALVALVRDDGQSGRMVRALSWRIGLSVVLFILLLLAWRAGMIAPHDIGG
ncbi:MAG: twin transmembrane helix small protein [Steroidobacteraceae bacterium]